MDYTREDPIIPLKEATRFIAECLVAAGAIKQAAIAQARVLVEADRQGHFSHGMNRLERHIQAIESGNCNPRALPEVIKQSSSTAWVDGKNSMGAVTSFFCMDIAIAKAKKSGIGWVTAKNCNHNGIENIYAMMAVKEGLIGMVFSNTPALVSPTRARGSALGTNPICFGAPAKDDDYFMLDMATSSVSMGMIEIYKRKQKSIPSGWAEDELGFLTTDPDVAIAAKCLTPLGGTEENSGYKGTGLSMMVEVLCGITAGSKFGPFVRHWKDLSGPCGMGFCFIVVDPTCFAPDFQERMSTLLEYIRNMPAIDPSKPVLVPGDWERLNMAEIDKNGGIKYIPDQLESCAKLSATLGVTPLKDINGKPAHSGGTADKICKSKCAKGL